MTYSVDAELMSAFNAINPATLDYDMWFKVSAVMHDAGLSEAEWDAWNQRDSERYTERINSRKWSSIKGDGSATKKTVFMLAYEQGWTSPGKGKKGSKAHGYGWDDELVLGQTIKDGPTTTDTATATAPGKIDAKKDEPPTLDLSSIAPCEIDLLPEDMDPAEMLRRQITALFNIGDTVSIALQDQTHWNEKREKWEPLGGTIHDAGGLAYKNNPIGVLSKVNQQAGAWIRINPTTGGKDENATRYATALVESDEIPTNEQLDLMRKLHLPCRCITSSAGKSVHAAVIIDAKDRNEYDERVRWLFDYCDTNGLAVDRANKNPGRYTRLAGATRGEKVQRLICESMGPRTWGEFRYTVDKMAGCQDDADKSDDEQDDGPSIEFLDLSAIVDEPIEPLDEVIWGLLPRERVGQIVARGGSGKTFMAYEAALCVASGREWLGFDCVRGRALYIDPELHMNDIRRRVQSIAQTMSIKSEDIAGRFDVVSLRGTTATADVLDEAIRDRITRTGRTYDLIIIDSINAILTGDENSSIDVRAFIASLQRLTKDTNAACLVFHHAGKGGSKSAGELSRGSSVFLDGPDECMELYPLKVEEGSAADELLKAHAKTKPNGEIVNATAWRLTFPKHRTGAPIKPVNIIFRHPVHIVDNTGELAECKVLGSSADHGADGGSAKGEKFQKVWDTMDETMAGIISDIHAEGNKATRAACLDVLNERREAMGMPKWSKATFRNNTLRGGKLRYRINPTTNELFRLTDEELAAESETEGGAVLDTP